MSSRAVERRRGRAQPQGHVDALTEILLELQAHGTLLNELVQVDSGESIAVPHRYNLNANRPFEAFVVEATEQFHSVKIDNPSGTWVELAFGGQQPTAAASDERVPPRAGRIITRPYNAVAIGIDPAAIPSGDTPVYVTFYSRPLPPTTYAFGGESPAITGVGYEDLAVGGAAVGFAALPPSAESALVYVEGGNIRWRDDGGNPTAAVGQLAIAGERIEEQIRNLAQFKAIAASGAPTLRVSYYDR